MCNQNQVKPELKKQLFTENWFSDQQIDVSLITELSFIRINKLINRCCWKQILVLIFKLMIIYVGIRKTSSEVR